MSRVRVRNIPKRQIWQYGQCKHDVIEYLADNGEWLNARQVADALAISWYEAYGALTQQSKRGLIDCVKHNGNLAKFKITEEGQKFLFESNNNEVQIVDTMWLAWLAGFLDGEGTFTIGICKSAKNTLGYKPYPIIAVGQKDSTVARSILEEIKEFAGGGITKYIRPTNLKTVDCQPFIAWQLTGVKRCIFLIELLLPFIRVKKEQVEKFIEICDFLVAKGTTRWTKEAIMWVATERDKLHNDTNRNYRTADDIKSLLESKGGN